MSPSNRYTLAEPDPEHATSRLRRGDRTLDLTLDGLRLDAQHSLTSGETLLWLTDDSPYDEALHVYLLSPNDEVLDAVEASAPMTPGVLHISRTTDDAAEFTFFRNDRRYSLSVSANASLRLPLPLGWRYKHHLARHRLTVRAESSGGARG